MAGGHSLIDGMRQALPALNPAERRVAQAVLRDISAATRLTTQDLSRLAAVSEPTVVRFARRMGSKGFADFKMRLSEDYATGRMFVMSDPPAPSQDPGAIAGQVYEATAQALAYAFAQRDLGALAAAADVINGARRLFCLGVGGSSTHVAAEAANRLFRFDVSASAISDPYTQAITAAMCSRDDALLVFSVTGRPAPLLSATALARQEGATVIAVTRPDSPLGVGR